MDECIVFVQMELGRGEGGTVPYTADWSSRMCVFVASPLDLGVGSGFTTVGGISVRGGGEGGDGCGADAMVPLLARGLTAVTSEGGRREEEEEPTDTDARLDAAAVGDEGTGTDTPSLR